MDILSYATQTQSNRANRVNLNVSNWPNRGLCFRAKKSYIRIINLLIITKPDILKQHERENRAKCE